MRANLPHNDLAVKHLKRAARLPVYNINARPSCRREDKPNHTGWTEAQRFRAGSIRRHGEEDSLIRHNRRDEPRHSRDGRILGDAAAAGREQFDRRRITTHYHRRHDEERKRISRQTPHLADASRGVSLTKRFFAQRKDNAGGNTCRVSRSTASYECCSKPTREGSQPASEMMAPFA